MKKLTKSIAMIVMASLLMLLLSSCGSAQDTTTVSTQPVMVDGPFTQDEPETLPAVDSSSYQAEPETIPADGSFSFPAEPESMPADDSTSFQAEPEAMPAADSSTGRQDGERFQGSVILEGMPEAVSYEHVKNETIGIELDYDYENFERRSSPSGECFISKYDNVDDPEIYLEIIRTEEDADSAAASISDSLSKDYLVIKEAFTLQNAGACTRLDASATPDNQTPDKLQTVYIIPLRSGCAVATAHYPFEAAEGFGHRFAEILNTLTVIK